MKKCLFILFLFHYSSFVFGQEILPVAEQQLENQADAGQVETEDDAYLNDLEYFRVHPINLNTADAKELKQLWLITDLQIENLLLYRKLFGNLLSLYELQAIPGWDIYMIRKLLPFVTVSMQLLLKENVRKRFHEGEHVIVFRASQVLEKAKGFDATAPGIKYAGSPPSIFFRYRYSYKNLLQYGVAGDKDAGEQFFRGTQSKGFDFYSFHLFTRKWSNIQALALGDFTVNLGQGLIQWQSLAFKKSAEVCGIKRQSAVLRPYNSAGEFYFNRGAGVTVTKGKIEATVFASFRKLSANLSNDTVGPEKFVSSFITSGYHRTTVENASRNNLAQTSFGGNISYRNNGKTNSWQAGINAIGYRFSLPMQQPSDPYNLYAIKGKNWYNLSVDYSCTYKNIHFFGEAAIDKNIHKAFINGLLVSIDPRIDISLLHRMIGPAYQAVNGNAFTENISPSNESGLYAGISIRFSSRWRLDAYADIYRFPWLKYLADAPGFGKDLLLQLTCTPGKAIELYSRFRSETKPSNQANDISATNYPVPISRQNWRTQINYKLSSSWVLRNRIEIVWYNKNSRDQEAGFLGFFDIGYRPTLRPWSVVTRLQYFETSGYNSRIYAYENDVLYSYSIPAFFDKGYRYYLLLNYDLNQKVSFWLRCGQTIYPGKTVIGSGSDEINRGRKTVMKMQVRMCF